MRYPVNSLHRAAILGCMALSVCLFALPAGAVNQRHQVSKAAKIISLKSGILFWRQSTWRWQDLMGVVRTKTSFSEKRETSIAYLRWVARHWQHLNQSNKHRAQNPPHLAAFMCIHHYEGSWTDSGSPYYGGLQMDLGFQETYAPRLFRSKGTADHWTPLEQIWTAEKAYRSRGFYPWPNTARYCGLL